MATILEVDGTVMKRAPGVSVNEVRFVPGTGWKAIDPEIERLHAQGVKIDDSLQPQFYDLSVPLGYGIVMHRPYLASNMDTVTNMDMAEVMNREGAGAVLPQFAPLRHRLKCVRTLCDRKVNMDEHPNANTIDSDGTPLIIAAVGFDEAEKASRALVKAGARVIVIDTENGYTPSFQAKVHRAVGEIRSMDGGEQVVFAAGNVGTAWGAEKLFSDVEWVKVGIGSGTACDTPKHGAHMAQLGAIYETAQVAERMGKGVIYDGGARTEFGNSVGAAFGLVMAGYYWAIRDESAGEKRRGRDCGISDDPDGLHTLYQGSGSTAARVDRENEYPDKYAGKKRSYRPSEGRSGWVKVVGSVAKAIEVTDRTLRLNMWYVGAYDPEAGKFTLPAFRRHTVFQRMSDESLKELDKGVNFVAPRVGFR